VATEASSQVLQRPSPKDLRFALFLVKREVMDKVVKVMNNLAKMMDKLAKVMNNSSGSDG